MRADSHAAGVQNPVSARRALSEVADDISLTPVEIRAADGAISKGCLYRLKGHRPRTGIHLMHPRTDQSSNYNIEPLARAGFAVLGRAGRWPNNDVATIHERLLLDMAAGIDFLHQSGCEKVVLLGNSGGSALAAFYQAQAEVAPGERLRSTAAGDELDLNSFDMPAADGLAFIAPHVGQGKVLGKMLDASVTAEGDPFATDPGLDMYDPANGFAIPPSPVRYDPSFIAHYRAAQLRRVERIDSIARAHIERQRSAIGDLERLGVKATLAQRRAALIEPHMIIHRTCADPAFVDLGIEPDDRRVGSYFSNRPDIENFGPDGFARYITPRAWLSTWSANASRASTIDNLALCTAPLAIVHYRGDCGTRVDEAQAMFDRSGSADKTLSFVRDADHYGFAIRPAALPKERTEAGTAHLLAWVCNRFAQ